MYGIPKNSNLCVQQFMQVLFYCLILDSLHSLPIFLLFFSENKTEKDIIPWTAVHRNGKIRDY